MSAMARALGLALILSASSPLAAPAGLPGRHPRHGARPVAGRRPPLRAAGVALIVWEDATAVRRRVLLRVSADAGRTLGPVRVLSEAVKAYAPDVKVTPAGDFLVAWHEERFPSLRTVVRAVQVRPGS